MLFLHILSREECGRQISSEKYGFRVKQVLAFPPNILVSLNSHRLQKEMWQNVWEQVRKGQL